MVGWPTMTGVRDEYKAIKMHGISRIIDSSNGNAVNHKAWIYIHAPAVTANTGTQTMHSRSVSAF